ncbi:hypothetical protein ACFFWC_14355 [Plantactinospora siamensis]|uniref:Class I SAM-dependent methyltransferase n=1 Tax=Plantactinospora siamensis TaxID=555372 RepID=A0ABV6P162_9ACTN
MSDDQLPGRVRLFGGELPTWSDLTSARGPARRGAQLPIVRAALTGRSRVLVAGPHDPDLLSALAESTDGELTCLVRSIPDARLVAEAFDAAAAGDRVRVVCGSLERYDERGFDAVVALDDVGRLYSTEGPEPIFDTACADLRRLLAADGVLIMMVDNELGLHWLTADVQPEADQSEPAWTEPATADDTRPRGPAELAERFGAGAAVWPVYPLPSAPVLAWGPAAGSVDRTEHAGLLAALSDPAARSLEAERPSAPVASLMRRVWRAGWQAEFAAGWLVVAGAGSAPDDVVAWLAGDRDEPVVVRLAGGRPVLPDGSAVPAGRLLSEVLRQAVVAPDQGALRSAVRGYAGWLGTLTEVAPAGADRVVVGGDGEHRPLALGGPAAGPAAKTADEQLLVAMVDLVGRAERHGWRRTWPSHLTQVEAVGWVAAMRGEPLPAELVARIAAEAGLGRPLAGAPAGTTRSGAADLAGAAGVPVAVVAQAERFEESNASRARWFETRLKTAEKQLAAAWKELDRARRQGYRPAESSGPAQLRRVVRAPLGRAKRLAGRVVRRIRR